VDASATAAASEQKAAAIAETSTTIAH